MKRYLTFQNLRLAVEILLVLVIAAAALVHYLPTQAASAAAPAAPDAAWYVCNSPTTAHIGLFTNRVHVWCSSTSPSLGNIHYFAFPTSPDSAEASRFMSLFQSATLSGRGLYLYLNSTDTSGTAFGCGSADCRRIVGAELR